MYLYRISPALIWYKSIQDFHFRYQDKTGWIARDTLKLEPYLPLLMKRAYPLFTKVKLMNWYLVTHLYSNADNFQNGFNRYSFRRKSNRQFETNKRRVI
jgi:hypothetical protein